MVTEPLTVGSKTTFSPLISWISRKKSFRSTSFKLTEIGSPVYLGAAGACAGWAGAGGAAAGGFCPSGAGGSIAGRANPTPCPVSQAGKGISGKAVGTSFDFLGTRAGEIAAGIAPAIGAVNETVTFDPSVCTV